MQMQTIVYNINNDAIQNNNLNQHENKRMMQITMQTTMYTKM